MQLFVKTVRCNNYVASFKNVTSRRRHNGPVLSTDVCLSLSLSAVVLTFNPHRSSLWRMYLYLTSLLSFYPLSFLGQVTSLVNCSRTRYSRQATSPNDIRYTKITASRTNSTKLEFLLFSFSLTGTVHSLQHSSTRRSVVAHPEGIRGYIHPYFPIYRFAKPDWIE